MAVPLHLTGPSCLHSKIGASSSSSSLNCATKVFTGLKSQSTSLFSSNLSVEFHQKLNTNLQIRSGNKRRGGPIMLMPLGTPMLPYKSPDGKHYQWLDIWNIFYRNRVVFIGKPIDEDYSNQMLATLLYLDTMGSEEPINLYINCPGGDLTPSMAVYDTLQSLRTPVGALCLGEAGDMAAFLLASANKGKRVAMPLAHIILRSPSAQARGRVDDVQVEAQELLRIRNYLVKEFAKHTGQPVEKVFHDLSKTKCFDTDDAIAYGIIDRCVRPNPRKKVAELESGSTDQTKKLGSGSTSKLLRDQFDQ